MITPGSPIRIALAGGSHALNLPPEIATQQSVDAIVAQMLESCRQSLLPDRRHAKTEMAAALERQPHAPVQPRIVVPLKRGLDRTEAAEYVGIGVTKFDQMVRDGRMPAPVHVDGRRVWDIKALDLAFDALTGHVAISTNPWDEP
jgi:excisionase family DNA binding protein